MTAKRIVVLDSDAQHDSKWPQTDGACCRVHSGWQETMTTTVTLQSYLFIMGIRKS